MHQGKLKKKVSEREKKREREGEEEGVEEGEGGEGRESKQGPQKL